MPWTGAPQEEHPVAQRHGTASSRKRMCQSKVLRTLLAVQPSLLDLAWRERLTTAACQSTITCVGKVLMDLVGRLITSAYRAVADARFERRYRVHTSGEVNLGDLGLAVQDCGYYAPSRWLTLRRILPPHEVDEQDVFIDFGSGKGRIVLQATTYPFKQIIGIELSEQLNEIASANLERYRDHAKCWDVELVRADARDFDIPDDVTVAFFYNPFNGPVFETVIGNLIASYDRSPRRMRIIYRNPVEEPALLATRRVRTVRSAVEMMPTTNWARWRSLRMYEITPRHSSDVDRAHLPVH